MANMLGVIDREDWGKMQCPAPWAMPLSTVRSGVLYAEAEFTHVR